ncbi:MAG: hypothetical protein LBC74_13025 [Planctomycetaceae bacterium]|nr:hypothetical protein [Planctomycetaceae bacterium]
MESIPGIGTDTVRTLQADLPELGKGSAEHIKLFTLKFSFTAACLPIGKQAFTLLNHAIYSTSDILTVRNMS